MNKAIIVLIGLILIGSSFGVYSLLNETEKDYDLVIDNNYITSNLTGQEPDYTEEYFIAIEIGNKTKFNFLKCLDGVLEITNTTIACVKESGEEWKNK